MVSIQRGFADGHSDNVFSPTSPGFDHVMGRLERCIKTAANVVIKGFEGFRGGSGDSKPFF